MIDVLSRMSSQDLPTVITISIIFLGGMLTAVTIYAITAFQRHREKDLATTLVLEMLDRGIPPAEIAAILETMGLDQPPEGLREPASADPPFSWSIRERTGSPGCHRFYLGGVVGTDVQAMLNTPVVAARGKGLRAIPSC